MCGYVQIRFCEREQGRFLLSTRLIVTGFSKEVLETEVKPAIADFLIERGLELSQEKTKITHINDGFDFLGQNVRKYKCKNKQKLLIKPSKNSIHTFLENIRKVFREARS